MAQDTTRREAAAALIQSPKNLDLRLDRLVAFIGYYQDMHRGDTPTVDAIANEMGVTHQTIRYWLGILEADGRIRRISHNPMRLMLKEGARPIEAARRADDSANGLNKRGWAPQIADLPEKRKERFEAAEARRLKLARFIGEHWRKHDCSPSLIQMMNGIGYSSGAVVTAMLEALRHRGLIAPQQASKPYVVELTESGRVVLGMKKEDKKVNEQTQQVASAPAKVVVVREPTKRERRRYRMRVGSQSRRIEAIVEAIAKHFALHDKGPMTVDLKNALGYRGVNSLTSDLRFMVEHGLATKGKSRYPSFTLTDKGRELLPEGLWPEQDAATVSQEHAAIVEEGSEPERAIGHRPEIHNPIIDQLRAEIADLKQRLVEALTAAPAPVEAQAMTTADMVLALIDEGFEVRRRA